MNNKKRKYSKTKKKKNIFYWIELPPFLKKSLLIRFRIRNVNSDKRKKKKEKKKSTNTPRNSLIIICFLGLSIFYRFYKSLFLFFSLSNFGIIYFFIVFIKVYFFSLSILVDIYFFIEKITFS
jgi:hypothetical protein